MSFLLLKKSSSRSSGRTALNSFHHGKHNLSTKNLPHVSSRKNQALSNDHRSFSSNTITAANTRTRPPHAPGLRHGETIESGSGEMQIQRLVPTTHHQQELDQVTAKKQQQEGNAQNDVVVSMDEVMEDLRILEQQQRESQRNLAAIKVVKQHKIEQRSSLDTKLFSLKYSNGEARFQLNHSRQVLSNSQRDLAAGKLRSERSNENLKKFDTKLKKAFDCVRGLHLKRRKMEEMMVLLNTLFLNLDTKEKDMNHKSKQLELDLEDAKYRETLLIKSIQSAKVKKQELVDEASRMRSELSILENDLTNVQQIEIQTKIRLEQRRSDAETEKSRHEEVRALYEKKMKKNEGAKSELEQKLQALTIDCDKSTQLLDAEWKKCVEIQKVEGHTISASCQDAYLNVGAIRDNLEHHKVTLATRQKEKISAEERIHLLEAELINIQERNSLMETEQNQLLTELERKTEIENTRRSDIQSFKTEVAEQHKRKEELSDTLESFKKEKLSIEDDFKEKKELIHSKFVIEKEKLIALTLEFDELDRKNSQLEKELEHEKSNSAVKIASAKQDAEKSNEALKEIQSRFENLDQPESEHACKEEDEETRLIAEISSHQQKLLTEYPSLASIDLSSDANKSKDEQIDGALSKLRASCEDKIEAARKKFEERSEELKQAQDRQREMCRTKEMTTERAGGDLHRKKTGSRHDQSKEAPKRRVRSDVSSRTKSARKELDTELPEPSSNDLNNVGHPRVPGTSSKRNYKERDSNIDEKGSSILRSNKKIRSSYGTTSSERKRERKRKDGSNSSEPVSNKTFTFPPKRAEKVRFHSSTYDAERLKDKKKNEIVTIHAHEETSVKVPPSRSNHLSSDLNGDKDINVKLCTTSQQKSVSKRLREDEKVHSKRKIMPTMVDAQKEHILTLKSHSSSSSNGDRFPVKGCSLPSKSSQQSRQSDEIRTPVQKSSLSDKHASSRKSFVKDRSQVSKAKDLPTSSTKKGTIKQSQSSKSKRKVDPSSQNDIKEKRSIQQPNLATNSRRRKKSTSVSRKSGTEPNSIGDFSFLDE